MGPKRNIKKRPCRICKKWFLSDPRIGDRQKTCGTPECQRQWHNRKCAEWNLKNRACAQENYLRGRLELLAPTSNLPPTSPPPPPSPTPSKQSLQGVSPLDYSRKVVQAVMGVQQLIIIEHIVRLLMRRVQAVIKAQTPGIQAYLGQLPPASILRGDGLGAANEVSFYPDA
jgi:hypothetical protein